MAGLSLNPNPYVLVTQAGIFLTSMYAIKALMVEPYLKVKSKRDARTLGSQKKADEVVASNAEKASDLEKKLKASVEASRLEVQKILKHSQEKQEAVLSEATKESSEYLKEMDKALEKELADCQKQLPSVVKEISDVCYATVVV